MSHINNKHSTCMTVKYLKADCYDPRVLLKYIRFLTIDVLNNAEHISEKGVHSLLL